MVSASRPNQTETDSGDRERRPVKIVRYGAMGWVGEFTHKARETFPPGSRVVVQTDRGIELGEPIGHPCPECACDLRVPPERVDEYVRASGPEFCRPRAGRILRRANEQDVSEHQHLNAHVREDVDSCAELAHRLGLDMKIITAEHLLGGERIVFYFGAPTRVDFRQLVRELAQRYRTRIEMRQVGARDEARLVADYEVCGRECCCKNFLKKLRPVNMKMAKLQKSTLDAAAGCAAACATRTSGTRSWSNACRASAVGWRPISEPPTCSTARS
jgi:cell fate regulator YaaT (PSP1 superfamily)